MHNPNDTALGFVTYTLDDEAATLAAGRALASTLRPGLMINLYGDLGAGKTCFTRGVLAGLGFTGRVKSPSYSLVEVYVISNLYLYHFDFYRFEDPEEWESRGLREYFRADTLCMVEWPENAPALPLPDLAITLTLPDDHHGRHLKIAAFTKAGEPCLKLNLPPLPPST